MKLSPAQESILRRIVATNGGGLNLTRIGAPMCDCEPAAISRTTTRRARIAHRCCECGCTIQPGEQYEYASGVWDGQGASYKTCAACAGVRRYYVAECLPPRDCCPCYGDLWEKVRDHGNAATRADMTAAAKAAGY